MWGWCSWIGSGLALRFEVDSGWIGGGLVVDWGWIEVDWRGGLGVDWLSVLGWIGGGLGWIAVDWLLSRRKCDIVIIVFRAFGRLRKPPGAGYFIILRILIPFGFCLFAKISKEHCFKH